QFVYAFAPIGNGIKGIAYENAVFLFVVIVKACTSDNVSCGFIYDFKCSFALHCKVKECFKYIFFPTVFIGVLFPYFGVGCYGIQSLKILFLQWIKDCFFVF